MSPELVKKHKPTKAPVKRRKRYLTGVTDQLHNRPVGQAKHSHGLSSVKGSKDSDA